jgi:hypothetical protein
MLGPFQVTLSRAAEPWQLGKCTGPASLQPFPVTFETVFAALETWPRMFIELDGSFVIVGEEHTNDGARRAWQLDGHLYDRAERLLTVELGGSCPSKTLEELIALLGVPVDELCIELRNEGVVLGWEYFLERYQ